MRSSWRRLAARMLLSLLLLAAASPAVAEPFVYLPEATRDAIWVIDSATNTVVDFDPMTPDPDPLSGATDLAFAGQLAEPVAVALSPITASGSGAQDRAYVTTQTNPSVVVSDATSNGFVVRIPLVATGPPIAAVVSPNARRLYVVHATVGTGEVSIVDIDPASAGENTLIRTVAVGSKPGSVTFHPDGTRAFVPNTNSSTVLVILLGVSVDDLVSGQRNPVDIDLDAGAGRIYLTHIGLSGPLLGAGLQRYNLQGGDFDGLALAQSPDGIALDVAAGRIY